MSGGPTLKERKAGAERDALMGEILGKVRSTSPLQVNALFSLAEARVVPPRPPRNMCDDLDPVRQGKMVLRFGSGGCDAPEATKAAIGKLQAKLKKCGLLSEEDCNKEKEFVGEKTIWAVNMLQKVFKIGADSVVGKYTMEALDRANGCDFPRTGLHTNPAYAHLTIPDWVKSQPKKRPDDVKQEPWYQAKRFEDIKPMDGYFPAYDLAGNLRPVKLYRVSFNMALQYDAAKEFYEAQRAAFFGDEKRGIKAAGIVFEVTDSLDSARTSDEQRAVKGVWKYSANPVNGSPHQACIAVDIANVEARNWIRRHRDKFQLAIGSGRERQHVQFTGKVTWRDSIPALVAASD